MINKVILVGRLTKDPVLRKTQAGASVVSFTVACARKVAQGKEKQTDFINCVAWNKTADVINTYVKKGHLIGVEGHIQTRNYQDESGKKQFVTDVLCEHFAFLESKKISVQTQNDEEPQQYSYDEPMQASFEPDYSSAGLDISSDDLPF